MKWSYLNPVYPLKVTIYGKISDMDFQWKIKPLVAAMSIQGEYGNDPMMQKLVDIERWGERTGNHVEIESPRVFRFLLWMARKYL